MRSALATVWQWLDEVPVRLTPSVRLRVLPRRSLPAPPLPGWRPWKPVVLPGGSPILNAFAIVQHPISASGATSNASGITTALTWATAPVQGRLLVLLLSFAQPGTTSENTTQGWIKGPTIANGTVVQTEVWYRVAGAGEGTAGPTFNLGAAALILYNILEAEVSGFVGTPTLDRSGTASALNVATLATAVSATITAATEFVFGGCGDLEGATAGIIWNASSAGGSATLGADIDAINPPKNGQGARDTWATSGASGTSPSLTFNLSSSSHTTLASAIATFKDVVSATDPFPAGYYQQDPVSDNRFNTTLRMCKRDDGVWKPQRRVCAPA